MVKITNLLIVVLIILLSIAVIYISYDKYNEYQLQKEITLYRQGAQDGYQQAIIQIVQQTSTCQQVPLFVENQTVNIISVDCLKN